ncbi:MAG: hypothetical protein ACLS8T_37000 [Anaerobutyricum sp.]
MENIVYNELLIVAIMLMVCGELKDKEGSVCKQLEVDFVMIEKRSKIYSGCRHDLGRKADSGVQFLRYPVLLEGCHCK